ncbi:protein-L-isoaspartate(D-aspartate) O-methyltransferase [Parasediminibacterium sp. JCM 36343]|uniref:protein-L-isoaspartate(D-aspartate) O-methyltransferase n=1 Tax=Parasediminibacterium sp. JCM 36343 TaxID=3374279 RepID=UPI00397E1C56
MKHEPKKHIDTYQHKGLRLQLTNILKEKGITDQRVLNAINTVPRHFFLDSAFDKIAYEDKAFPIGEGQTISQPYTVAFQTELLQVKRNDKVLEIGTGSMYQSTILAEMGAKVYTIERQKNLYKQHENYLFKDVYLNMKFFYGDGFKGQPSFAPFDKILITAAAPFIPPKLIEQLRPGGLMVLPLDDEETGFQRMLRITKKPDGTLAEESFHNFSFVPMLVGKS